MITVRHLDFSYDEFAANLPSTQFIFKDFHLDIERGECLVILGSSGSGKSTLIRLIAGLLRPYPKEQRVVSRDSKSLSFVFQEANLLSWLTVEQNIILPWTVAKTAINHQKVRDLAAKLKILDLLGRYPYQLSGGQKMRVSIARALLTDPEIIYMDEPFASLDEVTRFELQDVVKNIQAEKKMTIVFVTHSISEASYIADRIVILTGGTPSILNVGQKFTSREDSAYFEFQNNLQKTFRAAVQGAKV